MGLGADLQANVNQFLKTAGELDRAVARERNADIAVRGRDTRESHSGSCAFEENLATLPGLEFRSRRSDVLVG